jgi:hypothetical protein
VSGKAGNAILDFRAGFVDLSLSDPGKLAFQTIHLPQARPIDVIIEHGAGYDGGFFQSPMSEIDFAGTQEIGCNLSETRFGLVGGEQALNILGQLIQRARQWVLLSPLLTAFRYHFPSEPMYTSQKLTSLLSSLFHIATFSNEQKLLEDDISSCVNTSPPLLCSSGKLRKLMLAVPGEP